MNKTIENLKKLKSLHNGSYGADINKAIKAIKALEQQSSEDAISRQSVNVLIGELARAINDERCFVSRGRDTTTIMQDIFHLPSVRPQKIGHWIRWYEQKENDRCVENIPHCKCSECDKECDSHSSQFIKFCPNCGAKMEVEK